jgi:hypothetical protein
LSDAFKTSDNYFIKTLNLLIMNTFFADFYEFFYEQSVDNFSTNLYDFNLYGIIGLVTIAVSLIIMGVFYYLINSSRFNRWYHWLLFLAINFVIIFTFTYLHPKDVVYEAGEDVSSSLFMLFALVNSGIATVYYIAASLLFKRWSTNCSTTPF